jgi:hypothetical protein
MNDLGANTGRLSHEHRAFSNPSCMTKFTSEEEAISFQNPEKQNNVFSFFKKLLNPIKEKPESPAEKHPNNKIISKIIKIEGAGDAEKQREQLEKFGMIEYLENHYIEKE